METGRSQVCKGSFGPRRVDRKCQTRTKTAPLGVSVAFHCVELRSGVWRERRGSIWIRMYVRVSMCVLPGEEDYNKSCINIELKQGQLTNGLQGARGEQQHPLLAAPWTQGRLYEAAL